MSFRCELHPVYGAVLRDGDRVSEGDVIGLSVDGTVTITAPCPGSVRIVRASDDKDGGTTHIYAEILPTIPTVTTEKEKAEKEAGSGPTSSITLS